MEEQRQRMLRDELQAQALHAAGSQQVLASGDEDLIAALLGRPVLLSGRELALLRMAVEDPRTWWR